MSDLLGVVSAKLQSATSRIADGLKTQVQAQKNENAAKGLLRCGATLKQTLRYSSEAIGKTREAIEAEYQRLIGDSVWFSATSSAALLADAQKHLKEIQARGEAELKAATAMMGKSDLYERLQKDLAAAHDRALTDLSLFLDYQTGAKTNSLIKRVPAAITGFVSNLLKGAPR